MPTSRQLQKETTREAILRAAAEEFDAKGYTGTSIGDIAKALELTKGSVYFHFPSKSQLAVEIINAYFEIWTPATERVKERGLTGIEALRDLSRQVAMAYRDDVFVTAAVRLMREAELIDADVPSPFVGWAGIVKTYLDQAHGAGELRNGLDLDQLSWHLVATFFGSQEVAHQLNGRSDLIDRVDAMWGFILGGVLA